MLDKAKLQKEVQGLDSGTAVALVKAAWAKAQKKKKAKKADFGAILRGKSK